MKLTIFYNRLHENVQSCTKMVASRSKTEISNGVSRSPSIASLPLGQQKSFLNHSDYSIASMVITLRFNVIKNE